MLRAIRPTTPHAEEHGPWRCRSWPPIHPGLGHGGVGLRSLRFLQEGSITRSMGPSTGSCDHRQHGGGCRGMNSRKIAVSCPVMSGAVVRHRQCRASVDQDLQRCLARWGAPVLDQAAAPKRVTQLGIHVQRGYRPRSVPHNMGISVRWTGCDGLERPDRWFRCVLIFAALMIPVLTTGVKREPGANPGLFLKL